MPTPTPTITQTSTPTTTPTITPTPSTSGLFYSYYLSGCCDGSTLEIISEGTPLSLTPGEIRYFVWNVNTENNCFTYIYSS